MIRMTAGERMPLAALQRLIEKTQSELKLLTKERDRLRRRLAQVDEKIRSLSGDSRGSTGKRLRASNPASLVQALSAVLTKASKPLSVGEIMEKVRADGYRSYATNFRGLINQTLLKETKCFARTGRGIFQIRK
jgi:hypothetical protein